MRASLVLLSGWVGIFAISTLGADPDPISLQSLSRDGSQVRLQWTPFPAVRAYHIYSARTPVEVFEEELSGVRSGFSWAGDASSGKAGFYRVSGEPLSDDALYAANALNRLAYGPTPDELERVLTGPNAIGPAAYVEEQLAPESINEDLDHLPTESGWTYVTVTGKSSVGRIYFYLTGAGSVYLDDVKVVKGTDPDGGPNLLVNGDFESALSPKWIATANYKDTAVSSEVAHAGHQSVRLVASAAGSGSGNSFYQDFTPFDINQQYTFSYWYLPTNQSVKLTVRLTGTGPATITHGLAPTTPPTASGFASLSAAKASLTTLRRWYVHHAIESRRQLLEVMDQFIENHFVTEYSKTSDYLTRYYTDSTTLDQLSTSFEFRENSKWRSVLMNPQGTFKDLLQISAESPAQIIYLDTVGSRGDGNNIANENYSRELMELYTMGVDNGYDQQDITTMSRAWTGWSIRLMDAENVGNPFALQTTNKLNYTLTNSAALGAISNLVGVWTFGYRTNRHNNKEKILFPNKTVPARFGPPWAGQNYQLKLPARSGVDGIKDGYDIINHLSNLPFTEEFISVKLCRLFVHDDFVHGQYDYTDPQLSEEGKLVHDCMLAWENSSPKGQLRPVLRTIFQSELFRKHGGSMQKVKTPLEFCVSAIRALRADLGRGRFSASSDAGSIVGSGASASTSPMARMGRMLLFNRVEPNGYPESAPAWISAGTLTERAHFIQSFLMASSDAAKPDGMAGGNQNVSDPVSLLRKKTLPPVWSDAGAVTEFFLQILFPAEGLGNLADYRNAGVSFLNASDDGKSSSPFSALSVDSVAYDTRVRAMVSLLMMSPRFEEQ